MSGHEQHGRRPMSGETIGHVECDMRNTILIARLTGELDLSNAERIGVRIATATPSSAIGAVLDLTQLTYLDSAGIYVIHGLRLRLGERGQGLLLVVPNDGQVLATLKIAGVTNQIPITQTLNDALHALQAAHRPG